MWIGPGGTGGDTELTLYIDLTGYGLRATALFFSKAEALDCAGSR
jgi:hypothetical protein